LAAAGAASCPRYAPSVTPLQPSLPNRLPGPVLPEKLECLQVIHLDRRGLHVERARLGDDAADVPVACALRQADEVDDRARAIRLVVTFEPHGDLHWRAAEDAGLNIDECVLQRPSGRIVVMSNVAR